MLKKCANGVKSFIDERKDSFIPSTPRISKRSEYINKNRLSYINRYSREHFRNELDSLYRSIEEPYSHYTSIVMVDYKGGRYMYDYTEPSYYLFDYAKSPLRILTHGYLRLNKIGIPNDFICHKDFANMLYDDIVSSADDIIIKAMLYKDLLGYHCHHF